MRVRVELGTALVLAATVLSLEASRKEESLSRSFYVPVEVGICKHIANAVLYQGERPLRALPGIHVFQFTFFPSLGRIEPELERVRVEGVYDREPFRTELIVTPTTVYVGNKKIELDLERQLERLRRHIDARHEMVELKLRCTSFCGRSSGSPSRSR